MTSPAEADSEEACRGFWFEPAHAPMIVCSCNVLSDKEVRAAVNAAAPRTAGQVYGCLGCSAQCGRCLRTIRKIMDEALTNAGVSAGASAGCPAGCGCAAHKS